VGQSIKGENMLAYIG